MVCTLAEIFEAVELPSEVDGVSVLQEMLEANADRNPALVAALSNAITSIQDGSFGTTEPVTTKPSSTDTTKTTSTTSSTTTKS
jgi:hypothetical protein